MRAPARARSGAVALAAAALLAAGCGGGGDEPRAARPAGAPKIVAQRQVAPRVLDLTIRSPALGGLGHVRLLTPRGWRARDPERRWPVLYLLHGCCDSYESWTRETGIEAIARLRDVLVVMPEGGSVGFYSDWLGKHGAEAPGWETFHLQEVRTLLERDFGAGERRAVAGLSMGGLGAMLYAARRPHLFRAAAAFSGVLHPLESPGAYLGLFSQYTADPEVVWGDPEEDRGVWARHDPTEQAAGLRGVRLFVSAGDGRPGPLDPPGTPRDRLEAGLLPEAVALVARLARLDIPVRARLYGRGTHSWPYWERELRRALPLLLGAPGGRDSGA